MAPAALELGDVIEFGLRHPVAHDADRAALRRLHGMAGQHRFWHGYLHAVRPDGIVLHGPYSGPHEAYVAAQHALLAQIHDGPADRVKSGASTPQISTGLVDARPATPAQPPATVSVAFHDRYATVGDPVHGWLVVDAERLLAAMAIPGDRLRYDLTQHVRLTGDEPPLTLAALAAHHDPATLDLSASLTNAMRGTDLSGGTAHGSDAAPSMADAAPEAGAGL
jgi:hypothetical protein